MKRVDLSNVQAYTEFRRPEGGFVIKILAVEDVSDREYLKLSYDIVQAYKPEDAEFVGMYAKRKKERGYDYPTTVLSYKDSARPMLLGTCEAMRKSNNGFDFAAELNKDNPNEQLLVGKVVGVVIQSEEYLGKDAKTGAPKVRVRSNIISRRSVEAILNGDFKMPELKKLDQSATAKATPTNPFKEASQAQPTQPNPFAEIPQTEMPEEQPLDEIPF